MSVFQADDPHAVLDELARRDFLSFLLRAYPHIRGGADLLLNWHLDAIAYQLERVQTGACKRLLVTLPPRNLKSIMISVAWVAWMLGRVPSLNFVCISYSNELSAKHARDCRAIMQAGWYRRLFPRTVIASSRSAVHDFETTAGGGRLATSIEGTLTGRGGDIIIVDDPIKPEDAMSATVREGVNEWFRTTLASRLNDKKTGAFVTVMQRLHQHDLAGTLLESDGDWEQLSLPAIATEDRRIALTRGLVHHRRAGDVLHPEREPLDELMRQKQIVGSVVFEAQYQQQPVPAQGNMVQAEWLRTYLAAELPVEGQIVLSLDTASKEGVHNDWSVCIIARVVRRRVYILDVWRKKVAFPELRKTTIELARTHQARVLLIEDQASGTQLLQMLRNEEPRGVPTPIGRKPETDKVTRLYGVSAIIEAGDLLLPQEAPWLAAFKAELLGFPSGRHDDQVDALSQLLIWVDLQQRMEPAVSCCGPILIEINDYDQAWETEGSDRQPIVIGPDDVDPWV